MRNPLRKIQRIADWLDDRNANRESRRLSDLYSPQVAAAEKAKDEHERARLLNEWHTELQFVLDPVYGRKAERLTAEARKYGISVPQTPATYNEESDNWELSNATGEWLLTRELEERLKREIRVEKRASYDETRKWATVLFALCGFVLGLVSLLIKQKQPDPCPRNYYRSDSGQCVFALQNSVSPAQIAPVAVSPAQSTSQPSQKPSPRLNPKHPASHP